jgi:hypothetical protein
MNVIKASIVLLLLSPILASISFKCAALDGATYFDFSGLASAARKGDGKVYFETTGNGRYQIALCTEIVPSCNKDENQDVLVWGEKNERCSGGVTKEAKVSTSASYSKVL